MREICRASRSPIACHVLPASGDMKTPRPSTTSLRGLPSPVPTHTTFGLDGASAIAPIEAVGWSAKTAVQAFPPSLVFHPPPPPPPTHYPFGCPPLPPTPPT